MREISFDTETTGLNPRGGDRLVEIGGVELINHIATGNSYHVYINPLRDMPEVKELVKEDPTWQAFLDAIPTGGPEPFVTDYVGLQDTINEAVQGVVLGELEAAEAVEIAAEQLEEYK